MTNKLPKRLLKEPLLDAIFELRFNAPFPVSNILPGIFFSAIQGEKKLDRLPNSEIPEVLRDGDPNLHYIPLVRIRLQDYTIMVGDRSVTVACNLPYKGWSDFKSTIVFLVGVIRQSGLIDSVLRYSTRYVDLIQSNGPAEQAALANLSLKIGSHELTQESYHVRMDVPVDGFVNVIQIMSGAKVVMPDKTERAGVVIDIDTIKETGGVSVDQFEKNLDHELDRIHCVSKMAFFDCLTEKTLADLGPEYE